MTTEDQWTDCALRQLWAEGVDWKTLVPAGEDSSRRLVEAWLRHRDTLPRREPFNYPGPEQVRQLVLLYERFAGDLAGWLESLWGGALRALPEDGDVGARLDGIAHWRLNLMIGKRSLSPEQVVGFWAQHSSQVQATPAEQQVLRWYRAHEPWIDRWHPYREGSGALRRSPSWGAIYCSAPDHAAAAAAQDARTAYGGWGVWSAAVVAWAVASGQYAPPATMAKLLMRAMWQVDSQHPGVKAVHRVLQAEFPEKSWDAWCQFIDAEFTGYPSDHSLPNLLLIIGALYWYTERECEPMLGAIEEAGWDVLGNQLVAATLMGHPEDRTSEVHAALLNSLIRSTIKVHGHPPHGGG